jgi:phospho-N-acetylmuramoyl-pentapeptide-transferase
MNNALKIFLPGVVSFIVGIVLTPIATRYFYKYKLWRKENRTAHVKAGFERIHDNRELSTPRVGGALIWLSVVLTIGIFTVLHFFSTSEIASKLSFLSRNQTFVPLWALLFGSALGLLDDCLQIFGKGFWSSDPVFLRYVKIGSIMLLGSVLGGWFFWKLGMSAIYVPWVGTLDLGYVFVPFFVLVLLATWSTSVIDGIDGLAGGVLSSIFGSYTLIAFFNNQIDLAAFCAVLTGAILAFLWFNIPPARFYMGETGIMGLTVTLATIAFLTDTVLLLPVIALPLAATSLSSIIQLISRKVRNGKKVFLFAPLHHHFEALGWPKYKVTMRYWIVGLVSAITGVIIYLIS